MRFFFRFFLVCSLNILELQVQVKKKGKTLYGMLNFKGFCSSCIFFSFLDYLSFKFLFVIFMNIMVEIFE